MERRAYSSVRFRYNYRLPFSRCAAVSFIYSSSILDRALAYHPWMRSFKDFSLRANSYTSIRYLCLILSNLRLYPAYISAA